MTHGKKICLAFLNSLFFENAAFHYTLRFTSGAEYIIGRQYYITGIKGESEECGSRHLFGFFLISSAKRKKCVGVICHSSVLFLLFGSPGAPQCGQTRLNELLVCFCVSQKQSFPLWDQQIAVAAVTVQHQYQHISNCSQHKWIIQIGTLFSIAAVLLLFPLLFQIVHRKFIWLYWRRCIPGFASSWVSVSNGFVFN